MKLQRIVHRFAAYAAMIAVLTVTAVLAEVVKGAAVHDVLTHIIDVATRLLTDVASAETVVAVVRGTFGTVD